MKRQIILDDYEFINGNLNIIFKLDDEKYREDTIDENIFEEYIQKSSKLEFFEDCWDANNESHYTKDYILNYYNWRDNYCDSNDILDFLYYFYKTNKIPEIIEE